MIGETRPQPLRLLDVSRLMEPERRDARRMSSEADGHTTYNWTTLRYLADPEREITAPMGLILWSEEHRRRWFRLCREGERLPPQRLRRCARRTGARLSGDHAPQTGRLAPVRRDPYQTEPHPPLSAGWREQARLLIQWRVRLAQPEAGARPDWALQEAEIAQGQGSGRGTRLKLPRPHWIERSIRNRADSIRH